MSCTVIIIGYNAANRFEPGSIDPRSVEPPLEVVARCTPCVVTKAAVVFPTASIAGRVDGYILGFDSSDISKPAECYVFQFTDRAHAERWLSGISPRTQLVGKTVLVLDPSVYTSEPAT